MKLLHLLDTRALLFVAVNAHFELLGMLRVRPGWQVYLVIVGFLGVVPAISRGVRYPRAMVYL